MEAPNASGGLATLLRKMLGGVSPNAFLPAIRQRCGNEAINTLLKEFLDQNMAQLKLREGWRESTTGTQVLALSHADMLSLMFVATAEILQDRPSTMTGALGPYPSLFRVMGAKELVSALLKKPLPYSVGDLELLITAVTQCRAFQMFPIAGLLHVISVRAEKSGGVSDQMRKALEQLGQVFESKAVRARYSESKQFIKSVDRLLGRVNPEEQFALMDIFSGEAWSDIAIKDLGDAAPELRARWMEILTHARSATGSKPSQKWLKAADQRIAALGHREFGRVISGWFSAIEKTRTQRKPLPTDRWSCDPNCLIEESHATLLKGLAWSCIALEDVGLTRSLGDAACAAFKKVPKHGPRCVKLGNALVVALAAMKGDEPIAQLGRLSATVKHPSVQKYVGKGLNRVAQRTGQSEEDLSELSVPSFGLDANGKLSRALGDFTAEIEVLAADEVKLSLRRPDGKEQKSLPAQVKKDQAGAINELNRAVKDIRKMLPAQRVRIERLLMGRRTWSLEQWRERYADHPLVGSLARRLIWEFEIDGQMRTGAMVGGQLIDVKDEPIAAVSGCIVRLWHPIRSDADAVLAWRNWLERHQVTQPFKQAHREIYILTPAELTTVNYSNRFAAHIVRQHQIAALAQARGWTYRLQGQFDSHNNPTLRLPQYDLRVEYWLEPVNDAVTPAGIFTHVGTDQVRFYELANPEPMNLSQVDSLLFSEIMRDVDLFVGVASMGNDPTWQDAGNQRFVNYWQAYSVSDLGESAKTRKSVLEKLIPRLKIAGRCSFDDKFLIVRGDMHTYKIHLGSGNILFGGNDQYLCIVPDRSASNVEIYLPFEGDNMLSIILSKAFLLADDQKIKDPAMMRQIRP